MQSSHRTTSFGDSRYFRKDNGGVQRCPAVVDPRGIGEVLREDRCHRAFGTSTSSRSVGVQDTILAMHACACRMAGPRHNADSRSGGPLQFGMASPVVAAHDHDGTRHDRPHTYLLWLAAPI